MTYSGATDGSLGSLPPSELTSRVWDAVVVGGGHNGLSCAAYLARAGRSVLVLERRDRVGGAATVEEPWPGYRVSPCAYLVGLLHPRVVEELSLASHGFRVTLLDPQMFVPLEPGLSWVEWRDPERTLDGLRRWAPDQVDGYRAMGAFWERVREALRPEGEGDLWLMEAPPRELIEERLGYDPAAVAAVFEESVVDNLSRFLSEPRLIDAMAGQGVIGTNASPLDPGTASIRFHHSSGRLGGGAGDWGFAHGGIGMVSFALCDAARAAGAVVVTEAPVARIHPGEGVELESGHRIAARAVVSNADPKRTLGLVEGAVPADFARRVQEWPTASPVAKVNYALAGLPVFNQAPESVRAMVNVGATVERLHRSHRAAAAGTLDGLWAELYFQTAYDPSVAPADKHVLSAFVQYVPQQFADGSGWGEHREEVARRVTAAISEWAPGFESLIEAVDVSGPSDIEAKIGLTGGHIFQGECLPDYMWDRRMPYRTPVDGLYLCGAATHPGGSVIAVNGRNAALRVHADLS